MPSGGGSSGSSSSASGGRVNRTADVDGPSRQMINALLSSLEPVIQNLVTSGGAGVGGAAGLSGASAGGRVSRRIGGGGMEIRFGGPNEFIQMMGEGGNNPFGGLFR